MAAILLIAIAVISLIAIWLHRTKQRSMLPPGPPGFPIIGNLHNLGALPHQAFFNLSKKYGPIMMVKLGLVPTIVISSAAVAREVLSTHDLVFASRPQHTGPKLMLYNARDMAWLEYGSHWRMLKKICTVELFTMRRLEESQKIRSEELCNFLKSVVKEGQNGKIALDISTKLRMVSTNVVSMMAFHKKLDSESSYEEFLGYLVQMLDLILAFVVQDYIPFLWWLDYKSLRKMKSLHNKLDKTMQMIVNKHKMSKNTKDKSEDDVVDVLLSQEMSDNDIKAMILDLFLAGSDTSSVATEWAICELINNPKYMQKVREEMDEVVGSNRMVTEADLDKLNYLHAVVKETFRLHPPVPLLVPHESTQECIVNGYKIPNKSTVFVNVWSIGRDPNTWESPEVFNPDRFVEKDIDVKGKDFELIPFGSGRRMCPGMSLGLRMFEIMLAHLVHAFEWRVEEQELSMEEVSGLTMRRKFPLKAFATPRLPSELY